MRSLCQRHADCAPRCADDRPRLRAVHFLHGHGSRDDAVAARARRSPSALSVAVAYGVLVSLHVVFGLFFSLTIVTASAGRCDVCGGLARRRGLERKCSWRGVAGARADDVTDSRSRSSAWRAAIPTPHARGAVGDRSGATSRVPRAFPRSGCACGLSRAARSTPIPTASIRSRRRCSRIMRSTGPGSAFPAAAVAVGRPHPLARARRRHRRAGRCGAAGRRRASRATPRSSSATP